VSFDKSRVFQKLMLDSRSTTAKHRVVKRGQVYRCSFGCGVGQEQEKERPCVILQNDSQNMKSPNTIVAPITHTGSNINVVVPITTQTDASGNIIVDGHALLGNMVTVSKARLGSFVATLPKTDMDSIDNALMISVQLDGKFKTQQNILADKEVYIGKLKATIQRLNDELTNITKQ